MELRKDIEDLQQLLVQSQRSNSRRLLEAEICRLEELNKRQDSAQSQPPAEPVVQRQYNKRLTEYAWDQSDKFVKFYITVKGVETSPIENVKCTYDERSFCLRVNDLGDINYKFQFNHLLEPIDAEASKIKVKTDTVLVMLAKRKQGKWSHLTSIQKQADDARSAKYDQGMKDDTSDPSASIMNLMKKMYDEGDDDMKRNITKAWVESREKQNSFA